MYIPGRNSSFIESYILYLNLCLYGPLVAMGCRRFREISVGIPEQTLFYSVVPDIR